MPIKLTDIKVKGAGIGIRISGEAALARIDAKSIHISRCRQAIVIEDALTSSKNAHDSKGHPATEEEDNLPR